MLEITATLPELLKKYKQASLTATLQCGGNRRSELDDVGVTQVFCRIYLPSRLDHTSNATAIDHQSIVCASTCDSQQGLKWEFGAMSTANFEGVWLRDVLKDLGLPDEETARRKGIRWDSVRQ